MFDSEMQKIVSGCVIVTTKYQDKINGATIAWHARVSRDPPLVLVCIAKKHLTTELIEKSKIFAVNVLAEGQIELGKHFGFKKGRQEDKMKGVKYDVGKTGSPLLEGCSVYFDCKLYKQYDGGDHYIFVGEIIDAKDLGKKSLIYNRSDFFG